MTNWLKHLVRYRPVIVYYFITFLISWGGLVIVLGGPGHISSQPTTSPFFPLYLATVAGPFVTCILLTGLYDGKKGYRALLSRLLKWRVSMKWYIISLLVAPVSVGMALLLLSIFSPVFIPGILGAGSPVAATFGLAGSGKLTLVLIVAAISLFNGFVEEMGWTGFVAYKTRGDNWFIKSGCMLGMIWGLWHLLSNYIGSAESAGTMPLLLYMPVILFSFLPPFRILMTWIYDRTHSLLVAVLMHASLDLCWMLSMPAMLTGPQRATWYMVWAVLLWGLVFVVTYRKQHSLNQKARAQIVTQRYLKHYDTKTQMP